jgi:hypothetical protein
LVEAAMEVGTDLRAVRDHGGLEDSGRLGDAPLPDAAAEAVSFFREPASAPTPAPTPVRTAVAAETTTHVRESAPASEPAARTAPPRQAKPKPAQPKQEQMQFEPVTRGRFEKSEPTIVDGQDLDVPTFLRRNVKVK